MLPPRLLTLPPIIPSLALVYPFLLETCQQECRILFNCRHTATASVCLVSDSTSGLTSHLSRSAFLKGECCVGGAVCKSDLEKSLSTFHNRSKSHRWKKIHACEVRNTWVAIHPLPDIKGGLFLLPAVKSVSMTLRWAGCSRLSGGRFLLRELYLSSHNSTLIDSSLFVPAPQTSPSWNPGSYQELSISVSECGSVPGRHREMAMALDHRAGQSSPYCPLTGPFTMAH